MKATDIKDGASVTLLYSENVQGGNWGYLETTQDQSVTREAQTGMVWWDSNSEYATDPIKMKILEINSVKDPDKDEDPYTIDTPRGELTTAEQKSFIFSRPSSLHPEGVNAAFCDGHVQFLNQGIEPIIYAKLMAPDDNNVKVAGKKESMTQGGKSVLSGSISAEDLQ